MSDRACSKNVFSTAKKCNLDIRNETCPLKEKLIGKRKFFRVLMFLSLCFRLAAAAAAAAAHQHQAAYALAADAHHVSAAAESWQQQQQQQQNNALKAPSSHDRSKFRQQAAPYIRPT